MEHVLWLGDLKRCNWGGSCIWKVQPNEGHAQRNHESNNRNIAFMGIPLGSSTAITWPVGVLIVQIKRRRVVWSFVPYADSLRDHLKISSKKALIGKLYNYNFLIALTSTSEDLATLIVVGAILHHEHDNTTIVLLVYNDQDPTEPCFVLTTQTPILLYELSLQCLTDGSFRRNTGYPQPF